MAYTPEALEAMTAALSAAGRPELDPDDAIDGQLSLVRVFTHAEAVSVWVLGDAGPTEVAHAGEAPQTSAAARRTAGAILAGHEAQQSGAVGVEIPVEHGPRAALVAEGIDPADPTHPAHPGHPTPAHRQLLTAAAQILATLLDRRSPRSPRPQARRQSRTPEGAAERLLARVRFDLHDGPQQDVYLLGQDLGLFRDQLRHVIAGLPDEHRVLGRLDDLEAQVAALDSGLRRLSTSAQSPFHLPGSLRAALAPLIAAFTRRTGIAPRTEVSDDLAHLSDSQRVAVLALIAEALSNVRKHSEAETVTISVTSESQGVTVEVIDDGSGFDPQTTMASAGRDGHLGLVGMHDRTRMLGGRTRIDSRPGGPTVVSAFIPRWPTPPAGE